MKIRLKIILIISLLVFAVVVGFVVINAFTNIPEPISADQMENILTEKGLAPTNAVNDADENMVKAGLNNCIIAEHDDIKIEFYDFDNENVALQTYREAYKLIITTKMGTPRIQIKTGKFNYKFYSLDADETYSVAVYCKNTAVYAYCDRADKNFLNEILVEMGYIETK